MKSKLSIMGLIAVVALTGCDWLIWPAITVTHTITNSETSYNASLDMYDIGFEDEDLDGDMFVYHAELKPEGSDLWCDLATFVTQTSGPIAFVSVTGSVFICFAHSDLAGSTVRLTPYRR